MNETFKKGDRVWTIEKGWGTVFHLTNTSIEVNFDCVDNGAVSVFRHDTTQVFFKEQTLDYSRPKFEPKQGELCYFWDKGNKETALLCRFKEFTDLGKYITSRATQYDFCCHITELPPHLR